MSNSIKITLTGLVGLGLLFFAATTTFAHHPITRSEIANGAVNSVKIANNSIGARHIAVNAVGASEIATNAVRAIEIAANAVGSSEIGNGTIATVDMANEAITTAKIADSAVTSVKIADGTIVAADIAAGAVTTTEILDGTIAAVDIAAGTITTTEIATDTIVAADIATGAVTTTEILDGTIAGGDLATDIVISTTGEVGVVSTKPTGATGNLGVLWADLTFEGAAGGPDYYQSAIMGNFLGIALTNTTSSLHAGVIGSYNVLTSDANTGASAGLIGEVGDLAVADAAVMAVLGGDGGVVTPNAAYGVQYFNSTAGSHFDYGLDLFHAATADYTGTSAVEYGTADIRLASGTTISSGATNPATCVKGSIYLNTTDGKLYGCLSTDSWTANN